MRVNSGSLIVTLPADGTGAAQPVGLLFAGGGADTFANPAGSVLSALGSVVGSVGYVGGMPAGMALSGEMHPVGLRGADLDGRQRQEPAWLRPDKRRLCRRYQGAQR